MKEHGENRNESTSLDPLWEEAAFGREVQDFIEGDAIGQYLINRAREDLDKAQRALITTNPHNAQEIITLQQDARVALRVRGWLAEAIESGLAATVTLQQERDEHAT